MPKKAIDNQSVISSLKGADRVRKRPAVIFGSDGLEGCEHSFFENVYLQNLSNPQSLGAQWFIGFLPGGDKRCENAILPVFPVNMQGGKP